MIIFWLSVVVLVILAILCVAWPLVSRSLVIGAATREKTNIFVFEEHVKELTDALTRGDIDQAQYDIQKKELENILWEDVQFSNTEFNDHSGKKPLWALAIIFPLCVVGLYEMWGSYDRVVLSKTIERSVMAQTIQEREQAQYEAIAILEKNTKTQPTSRDDWYLLGEFYMQVKNYQKAVDAFGHVVSLKTDDADALAQYAQALYFAENNKLTFAITSTAEQAIKLNPEQATALGLLGIAAFENKQYQKAIQYWQKILWIIGDYDQSASSLKNGIEFAKTMLQKQGDWLSINVQIKIDPAVSVSPSQWIFIYAREPNARMPVAIVKMKAHQLPPTVVLDDTTTMPNGALLSSVSQVEVVVRLSETGFAEPSATDKEVVSEVISPNKKGANVSLVIK